MKTTTGGKEHTPGPWRATAIQQRISYGPKEARGVYVYGLDAEEDGAEAIANARLITAAPELLEAAKAIRRYFETGLDPKNSPAEFALLAAIAKAEGRVS
jgi:hypothetical protein